MKRLFIPLIAVFVAGSVFAQNKSTRNLSHFDEIDVGTAITVTLVKGSSEKAEVSVTGTEEENVITEVSGGELKVHMKSGNYRHVDARVTVTYVSLEGISIGSAAKLTADEPVRAGNMEINVSSAGKGVVNLDVEKLEANISSAGNLSVKGRTGKQEVDVSSAGGYDADDLQCDDAEINVSSGGHASIIAKKYLDAQANSGGSIRYKGHPDKEYTSENSGGNVQRTD